MMDKEYTQEKRSSLRDLVYVLFRRKWVILGVVLSTVIPVTVYTLMIPSIYEAKSLVLVKPGRENIYVAAVGAPAGERPTTIVQRVNEIINSEIQILKSRILVRRVVEQLRVAGLFPNSLPKDSMAAHAEDEESVPLEDAVSRALRNLSVERVKGAEVMGVAFRSHDPEIAFNFVATLVNLYLERHLEVHQSGQSYDFFKAQSNQLEQELKTAARKLADFRKKYGIVSFDHLKALTLEQYTSVNAKKKDNDTAIKMTQTRIDKMKQDLAGISEHTYLGQSENADPPAIGNLKMRLAQLELEKTDLTHRYKPNNPNFLRVYEAIAQVSKMIEAEEEKFHGSVSTGLSATYQDVERELLVQEANLEAFHTKAAGIEKQSIEYGKELERLGRLEPSFRALKRAVSVNEQNYRLYLTKFEESRVSDAMDAAKMVSVTVLEPATVPLHPVPVNRGLNIFLSLCIAGVAGLGLAFLLEYFDHTFRVPDDIKDNLEVALLGTIGDLPKKEIGDLVAIAASPGAPLHYQILKSNVVMYAGEKAMKTLSICSPTPGEGSSTVALNLAASLAKDSGDRVALVDANLRQPMLHTICNLPAIPGFSEVIHEGTNVHDAMKQSVIPNLSILTSGVSPPNPMVIFESPKLGDLIEVLKSEFDWIIFDCAPIDIYPDATVLARQLDGVALVIQAENMGAEIAIRAKENLEQAGAKILGAVLNRRRQIIPENIYKRLS